MNCDREPHSAIPFPTRSVFTLPITRPYGRAPARRRQPGRTSSCTVHHSTPPQCRQISITTCPPLKPVGESPVQLGVRDLVALPPNIPSRRKSIVFA